MNRITNLIGKHILVLGLGESGLAMARWCARQGAVLRVVDTRSEPPFLAALRRELPAAEFIGGEFDNSLLGKIDLVALSPGLSGALPVVKQARAQGIAIVGEIELFAWALRDLGVRASTQVIAITGTNGKTTTTALTGHLCRSAGIDAEVAGNISPSALDALMNRLDAGQLPRVWVLELSSFQLETLDSLDAEAATVLNISDDHLDRYRDLAEYAEAKARIFRGSGVQVLNRQDAAVRSMDIAGRRVISFATDAPVGSEDFGLRSNGGNGTHELCLAQRDRLLLPLTQLPIAGLHNAANALAALALCHAIGLDADALLDGLRSFRGLPHRVEKVAEIDGVAYYDDSKGTNVGATVAALEGLGRKVAIILGGDGKGQDFTPLRAAVSRHARSVALLGRDAPLIAATLAGSGVTIDHAKDMSTALRLCAAHAQPGDAVLLSPACASWDMYRDYVQRAEVFVAAVRELQAERAAA